jgi:hypothetical protein
MFLGELQHNGEQPYLFTYLTTCQPSIFLFSQVKTALRGRQFVGITQNVTTKPYAASVNTFHDCFVRLLERYKKCVAGKGDYYRGQQNKFLLILCVSAPVDKSQNLNCLCHVSSVLC